MRRARKGPAWAVSLVAVGLLMVMGLAVRVRLGSDWTSLLPDGHAYVTTAWQWFFEPAASSPNQLTVAKPTIPPLMREQSPGSCRPPGYPLFLAAVTRGPIEGPPSFFIPVKKWQLGLDLLTCVWVLLLARRLHGGAAGGIGLALALFCPTLVLFTAAILTETLATFLLTSLAGLLLWAGAAKVAWHRLLLMGLAGLVAAASALVRPDGLLCGLYLLALPLLWSELALGARLRLIACAVVPFVLLLSLWPLRNWVRFGRPHLYAELCDIRNQPLERTAVSHWMATWITSEEELPDTLWCLLKPYCSALATDYPASAFDSPAEQAELGRILTLRNRDGMSPAVDEGFQQLARSRLARHPLRTLVGLPLIRAYRMLTGRNDLLLRSTRQAPWPAATRLVQPWLKRLAQGYVGLAVAGLLVLLLGGAQGRRRLGWAMLILVGLRVGALAFVGAVESRYLIEILPLLLVLDGVALAAAGSAIYRLLRSASLRSQ